MSHPRRAHTSLDFYHRDAWPTFSGSRYYRKPYRSSKRTDATSPKPLSARTPAGTQTSFWMPALSARDRGPPEQVQASFQDKGTMTSTWDAEPRSSPVAVNTFYQRLVANGGHRLAGYGGAGPGCRPTTALYTPRAEPEESAGDRGAPAPSPRSGRLGAPWRHIRQCTGNLGNHICFVDGVVKEEDAKRFPPFGYALPRQEAPDMSPRMATIDATYRPLKELQSPRRRYATVYNEHAKNNFRFWHEDKKPIQGAPPQSIQGRMMKLGVGY